MIVAQNAMSLAFASRLRRGVALRRGCVSIEVRGSAYELYNGWLDGYISKRPTAQTHRHNYYFSMTGRNVTQWPGPHLLFKMLTSLLPTIGMPQLPRARSPRRKRALIGSAT